MFHSTLQTAMNTTDLWLYSMFTPRNYIYSPFTMRCPRFGAADEKQLCYLYITHSSCGCALLLHTVPAPAKLIWHLQIAWRWNHITVFRFQFHPLGKYCFRPLLFIKGTSYPLYAAIVLHGLCLQLCPWDNGIRDVQAAELLSCSHKGPQHSDQKSLNGAYIEISSLFWEWDASNTIHLMRWSYAEMV